MRGSTDRCFLVHIKVPMQHLCVYCYGLMLKVLLQKKSPSEKYGVKNKAIKMLHKKKTY
uniref:Uncharacterized protein n=1 Tax=Anguilla anguilla TaxID=7936 RepID=A0A0E9WKR0_ANGAN